MSRRRDLSDEEEALWSGVVGSITPLRRTRQSAKSAAAKSATVESATVKPVAEASPAPAGPRARAQPPPAAAPPPLAPLGRRLKQRVARGRDSIDARIDLHGYTQQEAHAALLRFLQRAQTDGARIALVVTGKGASGDRDATRERGVLKRQVPMWLSLPEFRSFVVGFEDAHVGHGGQGALYVRLRRVR